jgi:hypothetical protein
MWNVGTTAGTTILSFQLIDGAFCSLANAEQLRVGSTSWSNSDVVAGVYSTCNLSGIRLHNPRFRRRATVRSCDTQGSQARETASCSLLITKWGVCLSHFSMEIRILNRQNTDRATLLARASGQLVNSNSLVASQCVVGTSYNIQNTRTHVCAHVCIACARWGWGLFIGNSTRAPILHFWPRVELAG